MKGIKYFVTGLILTFAFSSIAQNQDINQLDQSGRKHGEWIKKYQDGTIQYKGQFNHGQPVGTFKRYHPNGKLKAVLKYRSPEKVYAELYNKKGEKQAEGLYQNQKKDSVWTLYNENGTLVSKDSYDKGVRDGFSAKYYENGDTSQIMHWNSGRKDGIFKLYFDNGNLKMQGQYKNGILEGYLTFFYPNGRKKIEGKYTNNLREGLWVYYNEYGDTTETITYQKGIAENEDSLKRMETKEILELERNEGKFADPRDQFYNNPRRK